MEKRVTVYHIKIILLPYTHFNIIPQPRFLHHNVHHFTPLMPSHLFILAVISPQLFDVDHGIDAASLIYPPHSCDPLVLCIRAHRLTIVQSRRFKACACPKKKKKAKQRSIAYSHSFEKVDIVHPNLQREQNVLRHH